MSFLAGRFTSTAIGAATTGAWKTVERLVAAVCGVSENQKSPIFASEFF
jgi:hypothetical protein